MNMLKNNPVFKIIASILVVTFITLDIAWAHPANTAAPASTLATPLLSQHLEKFKGTVLADVNLLTSSLSIGRYLLGDPQDKVDPLPIEYMAEVMARELGSAVTGIDLSKIALQHNTVLIPFTKDNKKYIIQIALKLDLSANELLGYQWDASDTYAIRIVPEDYKEPEAVGEKPATAVPSAEVSETVATVNVQRTEAEPSKPAAKSFSLRAILGSKMFSIDPFVAILSLAGISEILYWLTDRSIGELAIGAILAVGALGLIVGLAWLIIELVQKDPATAALIKYNKEKLHSNDPVERMRAKILLTRKEKAKFKLLKEVLSDKNPTIRSMAVGFLYALKNPEANELIFKAADDPDRRVYEAVALTLPLIMADNADPRIEEILIKTFARLDNMDIRLQIVERLVSYTQLKAGTFPLLIKLLQKLNINTLAKVNSQVLDKLFSLADNPERLDQARDLIALRLYYADKTRISFLVAVKLCAKVASIADLDTLGAVISENSTERVDAFADNPAELDRAMAREKIIRELIGKVARIETKVVDLSGSNVSSVYPLGDPKIFMLLKKVIKTAEDASALMRIIEKSGKSVKLERSYREIVGYESVYRQHTDWYEDAEEPIYEDRVEIINSVNYDEFLKILKSSSVEAEKELRSRIDEELKIAKDATRDTAPKTEPKEGGSTTALSVNPFAIALGAAGVATIFSDLIDYLDRNPGLIPFLVFFGIVLLLSLPTLVTKLVAAWNSMVLGKVKVVRYVKYLIEREYLYDHQDKYSESELKDVPDVWVIAGSAEEAALNVISEYEGEGRSESWQAWRKIEVKWVKPNELDQLNKKASGSTTALSINPFAIALGAAGVVSVLEAVKDFAIANPWIAGFGGLLLIGIPAFFIIWRISFPVSWFIWRMDTFDANNRSKVIDSLVKIGGPAVEPLIGCLNDVKKTWYARTAAAEALGRLGNNKAVGPLAKRLWDGEYWLYPSAAEALKKLNAMTAERTIMKYINDSASPDVYVRKAAPKSLEDMNISKEQLINGYIKALRHKNADIRLFAIKALGESQEQSVIEPLKTLLWHTPKTMMVQYPGGSEYFPEGGEYSADNPEYEAIIKALDGFGVLTTMQFIKELQSTGSIWLANVLLSLSDPRLKPWKEFLTGIVSPLNRYKESEIAIMAKEIGSGKSYQVKIIDVPARKYIEQEYISDPASLAGYIGQEDGHFEDVEKEEPAHQEVRIDIMPISGTEEGKSSESNEDQIRKIAETATKELARMKEALPVQMFDLVFKNVPESMKNLRDALAELRPISERPGVSVDTIVGAIGLVKQRYSLSDAEMRLVNLALFGPGQGGGMAAEEKPEEKQGGPIEGTSGPGVGKGGIPPEVTKLFEIVESTINNRRAQLVKAGEELIEFFAERDQLPGSVDLLLVLGSPDLEVARGAARLYKANPARFKYVMCSGKGQGAVTEAQLFMDEMIKEGVPADVFLPPETDSGRMNDNISLSAFQLEKIGVLKDIKSVVVVQTPLYNRQAKASFMKNFTPTAGTPVKQECYVYAPYLPSLTDAQSTLELKKQLLDTVKALDVLLFQIEKGWIAPTPVPPTIADTANEIKKNVDQLEADSIIASIIILARKAKREGRNLVIGLETNWIPGIGDQRSLQRQKISPLLKEIEALDKTLAGLGLDNVVLVKGMGDTLADKVVAAAGAATPLNLSNVVVLASKVTIKYSFEPLADRIADNDARPFLAAIDPTKLNEEYAKDGEATDKQLYVQLMEMLSMALELASGKDAPKNPLVKSYDKVKRLVEFLPSAEPIDVSVLNNMYHAKLAALQSA